MKSPRKPNKSKESDGSTAAAFFLILLLVFGEYAAWRVNHPGAPTWGFFLHK